MPQTSGLPNCRVSRCCHGGVLSAQPLLMAETARLGPAEPLLEDHSGGGGGGCSHAGHPRAAVTPPGRRLPRRSAMPACKRGSAHGMRACRGLCAHQRIVSRAACVCAVHISACKRLCTSLSLAASSAPRRVGDHSKPGSLGLLYLISAPRRKLLQQDRDVAAGLRVSCGAMGGTVPPCPFLGAFCTRGGGCWSRTGAAGTQASCRRHRCPFALCSATLVLGMLCSPSERPPPGHAVQPNLIPIPHPSSHRAQIPPFPTPHPQHGAVQHCWTSRGFAPGSGRPWRRCQRSCAHWVPTVGGRSVGTAWRG